MKRIHVVAAIIWNQAEDKILITKRPDHLHKGGFWEFPGGKVEKDESQEVALKRELDEELGLAFSQAEHFCSISYDYPEKQVLLDFYHVKSLLTTEEAREGQAMEWVSLEKLSDYQFPEANEPVVEKLQSLS